MEKEKLVKFPEHICETLLVLKDKSYMRVDFTDYYGKHAYVHGVFRGLYGSRTIKLEVKEKISPTDRFTVKSQAFVPLNGAGDLNIKSIYDGVNQEIFSSKDEKLFNVYK